MNAFWHYHQDPKPAAVYNIGGSRHCNCSVLEAIDLIQELSGCELNYTLSDDERSGDHIWWISDTRRFQADHPRWSYTYDMPRIVGEIIAAAREKSKA